MPALIDESIVKCLNIYLKKDKLLYLEKHHGIVALTNVVPTGVIDLSLLMPTSDRSMTHKCATLAGLLYPGVFQGIIVPAVTRANDILKSVSVHYRKQVIK